MNVTEAYLLLFVLLAVVAVVSVFFKNRIAWVAPAIFVACAIVTLLAGMGLRYREIVEGPFAYLDSLMWVLCGSMFSYLLYQNGTFQYIFQKITAKKRGPALQMLLLVLFIAIPGMITGTASAGILTTGLMAGKYLLSKGVEKAKAVEVVAVGALFGVVLPPLCMPAMLTTIATTQQGYPGAFEGFFLPCLIVALPALVVYSVMAGGRVLDGVEADASIKPAGGPVCLVPLIVVALLVFGHNFLYFVMPFLGYPLIYTIGFVLAVFLKAGKANPLESAAEGARVVAPELALMCAFGAAMETLTLVGTNGTLSAQMAILGVNGTLQTLVLAALVLVGGTLLGPCFAVVLATVANYLMTEALYGATDMPMLAMGMVVAVTLFTALRGGVVDLAGQALEVSGVSGSGVRKMAAVPVVLLLAVTVVYFVARAACASLMI